MSDKPLERPRQVTLSGWMILGGSVIVVLTAFQQVASLGTLEAQEAAAQILAEPPADGLGLTVQDVQAITRVMCLAAGGTAAATAILGWQVMQRSRGVRLALSLLAPVLFVSGLAVSGFVSALVVAAIVMLWVQPARDWFDGKAAAPVPTRGDVRPVPEAFRTTPTPSEPRAMSGFGTPASGRPTATEPQPAPYTSTYASPYAVPYAGSTGPGSPARRPAAVVTACVLTWVLCGLTIVMTGLSVLVVLASPDELFTQLREQNPELAEQGLTDGAITSAVYVVAAVVIPWCLAAGAFAVFAFRRAPWARVALLVSAGVAAGLALVAVLSSVVAVVPLAAAVVTVAMLARPEVRAWYGRRDTMSA